MTTEHPASARGGKLLPAETAGSGPKSLVTEITILSPSAETTNPVGPSQTQTDVACTICGCVCDDLTVTHDGVRVLSATGTCSLSHDWILSQGTQQRPPCSVQNSAVEYRAAIKVAGDLLAQSRFPLVYGLSRSSTPGQRAAAALAETLGASIDTTASQCHASSVMALQDAGEQTCTLGEVRNRADVVIYWGCNPLRSHPRHLERYSADPIGRFVPAGRAGRHITIVDIIRTASADHADEFIQIEPESDFEALWTLRALVRGLPITETVRSRPLFTVLQQLADRMKSAQFGIVFFGLGLSTRGIGHHNVGALLQLVRELNDHTRFYARRMRIAGDVTGADCLLAWQTGYPFSVNLSRKYPRFNPVEFTANDMLHRGEPDACVLVGSESLRKFSPAAMNHLRSIPVIALDYPGQAIERLATVQFHTAVYGMQAAGTAYRMDEVPIPLRGFLASDLPTDETVLNDLHGHVRNRLGL